MSPKENEVATSRRKTGLLRWYAENPVFGFAGSIASLIAIPLAFLFFFISIRTRELTFYVSEAKSSIVKAGQTSDLHVLYKDQPVKTDVTAIQVAIWNAGNEAIRPGDILEPVNLVVVPTVPILEAKIKYVTRPLIAASLSTDKLTQGSVGFEWKILEHNDGAVIQLIVAGSSDTIVNIQGALEGQPVVKRITTISQGKSIFGLVQGLLLLMLSVFICYQITCSWIKKRVFGNLPLFLFFAYIFLLSCFTLYRSWHDFGSPMPLHFDVNAK